MARRKDGRPRSVPGDRCSVSMPHEAHTQRWPMGWCPGVDAHDEAESNDDS